MRTLLRALALLPLPWLHGVAALLGSVMIYLPGRSRDTTRKNLQACFPHLDAAALEDMARDSLRHTACTALEMGKAWRQPLAKTVALVTQAEGEEAFTAANQAGNGVILLAPHLSNWEIFGFYATDKWPASFMYQPPRYAVMDRILRESRSRGGVQMVPTNRKGVAQLLAALQQGHLVGVLPDQVPADGSGEFAPFFGQPAYTMTLVSRLARRTGAAVICGFAMRLPRGAGFKAVFRSVDEGIYSDDIQESLLALNQSVEECVRLAPSQYQWEYKRFRRQPDNQPFY